MTRANAAAEALPPYLARIRESSEPALTPIRMGVRASEAALAISATLSSNLLQGCVDTGRDRRGHRLHGDRSVAADGNRLIAFPHDDLARPFSRACRRIPVM